MRTRKQNYTQKQYRLYDYNLEDKIILPDGSIGNKSDGWDNEGYYGDLED